MRRRDSVRWTERLTVRLLVPIIAVLSISMLLSLFWLYRIEKEQLLNRTSKETALVSEVIKAGIRNQMLRKYQDMTQATIDLIQRKAGLREVTLVKKDGTVAYSSNHTLRGRVIDRHSGTCKICHTNGVNPEKQTVVMEAADGNRVFRSVNPIENEKACKECHEKDGNLLGVLIVDQFISRALLDIQEVQTSLFIIGAVTLFVLFTLIFAIVEILVQKPISLLIEGTRRVRDGDLTASIDVGVKGEIRELADAFNTMVAAIRDHVQEIEEKNFELRTLYSMVERITRTINLNELRKIVLDIILEVFARVDYGVIVFRLVDDGKIELFSQKSGEEKIVEKAFERDEVSEYREFINPDIVEEWDSGLLDDTVVTDGGSGIIVPLTAKGRKLGILYVKKENGETFSDRERKLIQALSSHISMALENARLYTIAITDELTKAYTLRYFQQVLTDEVGRYQRYGQKVSILMLDLDDFKKVNDTYGHPVGDVALREFVRLVKESVREVDVVCRYGGEEFAVILPETDGKSALIVAERIRERTEKRVFYIEGHEIKITVSIGVSSCPRDAVTVRDLVNEADKALYRAKESGKNCVRSAGE
ncbi:MAG: diguanylate cyclase [Deltaproteobacteria bacterium]|nr:MAG: diguanylate cyclase [Deltaproteobacteria bacterium]